MAWSKESRQSRGYGAQWEKIRAKVIERAKGLCEECAKHGRVTQGRDVDHIVPKAKAKAMLWNQNKIDNPRNLQYLCLECHKAKTAKDEGRTYHGPRPRIGLDGYPVE
jgi:5-methylcytosine-specific restriction protein A